MNTDTLWNYLGLITCTTLLVLFTLFCISEKHINYYYLGSENGSFVIRADIENSIDVDTDVIGLTYEEAIALVAELNKTLPIK